MSLVKGIVVKNNEVNFIVKTLIEFLFNIYFSKAETMLDALICKGYLYFV